MHLFVFEDTKTAGITEMLRKRIPDFGCCGAKGPRTVFNCSHLWNLNCSLVPKIIRMIFKVNKSFK